LGDITLGSNRAMQRTVTSGLRPLVPAADGNR
jgi:hypothetical protein